MPAVHRIRIRFGITRIVAQVLHHFVLLPLDLFRIGIIAVAVILRQRWGGRSKQRGRCKKQGGPVSHWRIPSCVSIGVEAAC